MICKALVLLMIFCTQATSAADDMSASQRVSESAMRLQNHRLKLIAENIANANIPAKTPDASPYRRKFLTVRNDYNEVINANLAKVDQVNVDTHAEFVLKYEPSHPSADSSGYVKYPNVNIYMENIDSKEAQRTYEANLNALEIAKSNQHKLIEALK